MKVPNDWHIIRDYSTKHTKYTFRDLEKKMRKDWDQYFMSIAKMVSERSTCDRKHVGAVIVRDNHILATGYNGSVSGMPHCDTDGHVVENEHCIATVHAEANAIVQAARYGTSIFCGEMYVTAFPCWNCFKLLANSGIMRIYYAEDYKKEEIVESTAFCLGITIEKVEVKNG